jgi:hypothetical protein
MSKKPDYKAHILLNDKFLGSLIYMKDNKDRAYLKLSFKKKVSDYVKWTDIATTLPAELEKTEHASFDVSYKFEDNLLEVKRQVGSNEDRSFYHVPFPPNNLLFILKIKDWHTLDTVIHGPQDLILPISDQQNTAFIFFSFVAPNGLPFTPGKLVGTEFRITCADLPEKDFPKICVGIAEIPDDGEVLGMVLKIPYPIKSQIEEVSV